MDADAEQVPSAHQVGVMARDLRERAQGGKAASIIGPRMIERRRTFFDVLMVDGTGPKTRLVVSLDRQPVQAFELGVDPALHLAAALIASALGEDTHPKLAKRARELGELLDEARALAKKEAEK